jgi:hypothetical protein
MSLISMLFHDRLDARSMRASMIAWRLLGEASAGMASS